MASIEEIRDALAWYRGVLDHEGWEEDERSAQADTVMHAAIDELAALRTQVEQMRSWQERAMPLLKVIAEAGEDQHPIYINGYFYESRPMINAAIALLEDAAN